MRKKLYEIIDSHIDIFEKIKNKKIEKKKEKINRWLETIYEEKENI